MGTHAMIGFYNQEDGSVEASYVHYDGYVEGVGAVASVGYLSSLEEDLDTSISASVHKNESTVPYESVDQYMKNGYDYCGAHYLYLFDGEVWFYATRGAERRFEEVEMNLKAAA